MVSQAFPCLGAIGAFQVFLDVILVVPRQADAKSEHRGVSQQSVAQLAVLVQVVLAALVDLLLDESQDRVQVLAS